MNAKQGNSLLKIGRLLLFISAILYTLVIMFVISLLLANGREAFMLDDFGGAWLMLSQKYPHVTDDFFHIMKREFAGLLCCGLFSLSIITFAFNRENRWAWFTLWILPAIMIEDIQFAIEKKTGLEYLFGGLALLAIMGLILSYRTFFLQRVN